MPGAAFKRKAFEWRKLSFAMVNQPFDMVRRKLVCINYDPMRIQIHNFNYIAQVLGYCKSMYRSVGAGEMHERRKAD